jgi:hypothetical protein
LVLLLSAAPFIRLFSLSVILNVDFEVSDSFYGEGLREDVAAERLGDKANTEVIVGVNVIVNDIITITNNKGMVRLAIIISFGSCYIIKLRPQISILFFNGFK